MRKVLISGAGIAGATAAYWLAKGGCEVTVVEQAQGMRSSGSPVDVRGPAVEVAERMGVMAQIREAATDVRDMVFVNASGRAVSRVNMRTTLAEAGDVELPRGDLAAILRDAVPDDVEFVFGDSVTTLEQDADGVTAVFASCPARRFDLVIGADGAHSAVRALAFGPETDYVRHLGVYVATVPLDGETGHDLVLYNTPGGRWPSTRRGAGRWRRSCSAPPMTSSSTRSAGCSFPPGCEVGSDWSAMPRRASRCSVTGRAWR
jgi:2-polyprenyl-6-methoxyphenol hydroxylase-like FAD-dependent oxidoreductase